MFSNVHHEDEGMHKAPLQLHILIIGCGIGGLAAAYSLLRAGHRITIIEAAHELGEVGAGIQISPNVSRLLIRWGLGDRLAQAGVQPEGIRFRRYVNGEAVGYLHYGASMLRIYNAPYYHIHRADLHSMLFDLISGSPNLTIRLRSNVVFIDPTPNPCVSVKLASGEVISGDIIVGADGVKSFTRSVVVGCPDNADPTGDAAYRAVIPTDVMLNDPELRSFVETPETSVWMGPRRHMVGYCIRAKLEYNLVMIHPDDGSVESWTAEGSADKLRADFEDFEPRVKKLLSHVKSTLKWRLMDRKPLERWVHQDGRVVLLGDACHPMLPYRSQGAAMAIEDGSMLGLILSKISDISQSSFLLQYYERLRYDRTSKIQAASRQNQHVFHLLNGQEQQARDDKMRQTMARELQYKEFDDTLKNATLKSSDSKDKDDLQAQAEMWDHRQTYITQFAYDADEAVERWWIDEGQELLKNFTVESRAKY